MTVSNISHKQRFFAAVRSAIRPSLQTAWWMARLTLIVSLAVSLLQYVGVVSWLSDKLAPVFQLLGLPGEAALAFITGYFVNIYSAIAVIDTLDLSVRAVTILGVMCLCAHNMVVETAVQKKTGSSVVRIVMVRTLSAFVLGFALNFVMPEANAALGAKETQAEVANLWPMLGEWVKSSAWLVARMTVLIVSLNIMQRVLTEFGAIKLLSKLLRPLLVVFGLPARTSFLWIVANILGLAYGAAVMVEESKNGTISPEDADLLNHHISISHSNLEDLILFISVGGLTLWMLLPRWLASAVIVWVRKLELKTRDPSIPPSVV